MTYVITSACIGEKARECLMVCPVDCIYDAGEHYVVDPSVCIDCGSCKDACPVQAVYRDDELPAGLEHFLGINSAHFLQQNKTGS